METIIRIDRTLSPEYPARMDWLLDPELERSRPTEYDLAQAEQWVHPRQGPVGPVPSYRGIANCGFVVYAHLLKNGMVHRCLGFADALEIQKRGTPFFHKAVGMGRQATFWGSVIEDKGGGLSVPCMQEIPCIYETYGELKIFWTSLVTSWYDNNVALLFPS